MFSRPTLGRWDPQEELTQTAEYMKSWLSGYWGLLDLRTSKKWEYIFKWVTPQLPPHPLPQTSFPASCISFALEKRWKGFNWDRLFRPLSRTKKTRKRLEWKFKCWKCAFNKLLTLSTMYDVGLFKRLQHLLNVEADVDSVYPGPSKQLWRPRSTEVVLDEHKNPSHESNISSTRTLHLEAKNKLFKLQSRKAQFEKHNCKICQNIGALAEKTLLSESFYPVCTNTKRMSQMMSIYTRLNQKGTHVLNIHTFDWGWVENGP